MNFPSLRAAGLVAVAAWSVLGCEVGPNFRAPQPPVQATYVPPVREPAPLPAPSTPRPTTQTIALGEEVTAQWWTLFHSAALDALVKQALTDSWSLEAARAHLLQSQEVLAASRSALWPQAGLNVSVAREKLTAASFGLPAGSLSLPPNFTLLQVGPTASYSLDLFGGTRRRIEQASALAETQTDRLRAAYLSLTGNTVMQVIALAALREEQRAALEIVRLDRQNVDLIQTANREGGLAQSDVVQAQAELAQDEALLPPLELSLASSSDALAVLVGRAPAAWTPPSIELDSLTLPERLPVSLPSKLVRQRPDILAAEAELHAASAQVGIATAALYPEITLSAFINGSSLNGSNLFNPGNIAWSIAAGLTQPIFDAHLRRSQRREALAAFRASAADYQQTILSAFQQVADLLQALEQDGKLIAAQKAALAVSAQSVELQRASYLGGGSGILGLLEAQRQYHQASILYARAEGQRYRDTAQLLMATGAGLWAEEPH